ncbi:MAG: phosphoribosylglycinamide formyltransferase [Actinobacteria bacterium]|uniref:phosphoribosylglycinamide formyltransferase 1 n=1 Tax=freshwater metagenome TaxID=449393 RepID=A0A6J6NZJ0_9ZZZZ|nr:phosphoribosylglycinamide formyltransferase [Actinomycetota bacterium]
MTVRIVVLASGNGSNLQALLHASADGRLNANIVAVVSNNAEAFAHTRAANSGVPSLSVTKLPGETREQYDTRLGEAVAAFQPHFVVLAGWMRILTMAFLSNFPNQVINLHPALPGEFPGTHSIERALAEHKQSGLARTGVMVHYVPDERVDEGDVIASVEVPINPLDSLETLEARVHAAEHALLVQALQQLAQEQARNTPAAPNQ